MYSTTNSKLKKNNIYSFNLPAIKTCPMADSCKKFCYACQGCYVFPVVKAKREQNFDLSQSAVFVETMVAELQRLLKRGVKYYRLHDSGDFYSLEYAEAWNTIAKNVPSMTIYAYTKSISIVKNIAWNSNILIRYSFGGLEDCLINVDNDLHAKVFLSINDLNNAGYIDGSETDMIAIDRNTKKLGLVYHGTKKIKTV